MKRYLPQVVNHFITPRPTFNTNILSIPRVLNKRKMLKECMKVWTYHKQDELHRDIASSYFGLVQAIKQDNEPMVMRNLSIQLFQQYRQNPKQFILPDKISDIVIVDCIKTTHQDSEWFHLYVTIKHFKQSNQYSFQRKLIVDPFSNQTPTTRKWYFIEVPLKKQ